MNENEDDGFHKNFITSTLWAKKESLGGIQNKVNLLNL